MFVWLSKTCNLLVWVTVNSYGRISGSRARWNHDWYADVPQVSRRNNTTCQTQWSLTVGLRTNFYVMVQVWDRLWWGTWRTLLRWLQFFTRDVGSVFHRVMSFQQIHFQHVCFPSWVISWVRLFECILNSAWKPKPSSLLAPKNKHCSVLGCRWSLCLAEIAHWWRRAEAGKSCTCSPFPPDEKLNRRPCGCPFACLTSRQLLRH